MGVGFDQNEFSVCMKFSNNKQKEGKKKIKGNSNNEENICQSCI